MSGEAPADWTKARLGDHAIVKARLGWKGLKAEEYVHDGPIFLAAPNLRGGRIDFDDVDHLPQWRYDESPEIQLAPGDVLLVKDGSTLGMSGIVKELPAPTTVNGSIAVIRPWSSLLSGFLYHCINGQDFQRLVWLKRSGLGVPHLFQADLREFEIRLPEIPEQRRVSECLSALDETIAHTEALISKYEKIRFGLMHDLFTRGVSPDGCLRPPREDCAQLYKPSPLGWIPQEWGVEFLDVLAYRGSGHTPNKRIPEYWNGGIKWVSLADCTRLDSVYITDTSFTISELGIQNSSAVLHPAGTVILSRDAGVGKSAITTEQMAVSQHFMAWKCGPRLSRYYLYYWFQEHRREFENIATGSTIPTIGLRFFKMYKIAVPTQVREQEIIGSILLTTDQKLFALEDELHKLRELKSGLMQDLLTGRVRVKLAEAAIT